MVNKKITEFKRISDNNLKCFYKENPEKKRFVAPDFTDSIVQERMMRIGAESRALQAHDVDEYFVIAIATLQNDYLNRNAWQKVKCLPGV